MVRRIGDMSGAGNPGGQERINVELDVGDNPGLPELTAFTAASPLHRAWHDGQNGDGGNLTYAIHDKMLEGAYLKKRLALLRAEASEEALQQLEVCNDILKWRMFAEARDVLPQGLAYEQTDLGPKIVLTDEELGWRLQDLNEEYEKGQAAGISLERQVNLDKSVTFDQALDEAVQAMPAYNSLMALCTIDERVEHEQPLTKAQRQIVASNALQDLQRQGGSLERLHEQPNLRRKYQETLYTIDERTVRQPERTKTNHEQRARTKVITAIWQQMRKMGLSEAHIRRLQRDGPQERADSFGMETALAHCISAGEPRDTVDMISANETFIADFLAGEKDLAELCHDWKTWMKARIYSHVVSVFSRPITDNGFTHIPILYGDALPKGPIVQWKSISAETSLAVVDKQVSPSFFTLQEYAASQQVRVGEARGILPGMDIPRMLVAAASMNEHDPSHDVGAGDAIHLRWKGIPPHLLGYDLRTTLSTGEHVYAPNDEHDPYGLPATEDMLIQPRLTRNLLRDMGLDEMASYLWQNRDRGLTVWHLAGIVSRASDYYVPDQAEWLAMQEALNQRDFKRLKVGGYLLSMCTVADVVLDELVRANGYDTYQVSGWSLPYEPGPISATKHVQTGVVLAGKDYVFDATPQRMRDHSAVASMPQQPLAQPTAAAGRFSALLRRTAKPQAHVPEFGHGDRDKQFEAVTTKPKAKVPAPATAAELHQAEEALMQARQEDRTQVLQTLERQMGALYGIQKPEMLYKEIARRVPQGQRRVSPLWRTLSLARQVAAGQSVTRQALEQEMRYITAVTQAGESTLRRGQDTTPQMASMLRHALQTLHDNLPETTS